jgi:hypothetical protein
MEFSLPPLHQQKYKSKTQASETASKVTLVLAIASPGRTHIHRHQKFLTSGFE